MSKTICVFLLCCVCLFCALWLSKEELNENGEKTYASELSSSGKFFRKEETSSVNPLMPKVSPFDFKGESVFIRGECDLLSVLEKYDASIVKSFENAGITEYYLFSSRLRGGVETECGRVNLHVAVTSYGYTVGTPFVFYGY